MSPLDRLRGGLVASVQPVDDGPMDNTECIVAMARCAVAGGAVGLRIQGVANLAAVRQAVDVPIIGIVKRDSASSPIRITPTVADAQALIVAGADIVAIDMTLRERDDTIEPIEPIARCILDAGRILMGDCATEKDGAQALKQGAMIIGTTLSGYTAETEHRAHSPDFELIKRYRKIAGQSGFVMAEGRFNSPENAAAAIATGADCVTVGSALTRLEHVVGWFDRAIRGEI